MANQDPMNAQMGDKAARWGMRDTSGRRIGSDSDGGGGGGNVVQQGGYVDTIEAPTPGLFVGSDNQVGFIERSRRGQDPAWHKLGQLPIAEEEDITITEAARRIRANQIDVRKAEGIWLLTDPDTGAQQVLLDQGADKQFRLVRLPMEGDERTRVFGKPVSTAYHITQVNDVVAMADRIGITKQWPLETAGILFNGEQVFFSFKSDRRILRDWAGKTDEVWAYFIMRIALDGQHTNELMFAGFRPVCRNTLRWAMQSATTKISIVHTAQAAANMELFTKLMTGMSTAQEKSLDLMQQMAAYRASEDEVEQIIAAAFPFRKKGDKLAATEEVIASVQAQGISLDGVSITGDTSMLDLSSIGSDVLSKDDVARLLAANTDKARELEQYNERMKRGRELVAQAYAAEREQFPTMGGLWLAVNAATEFADWALPTRAAGVTPEAETERLAKRVYGATFDGEPLGIKTRAVKTAERILASV